MSLGKRKKGFGKLQGLTVRIRNIYRYATRSGRVQGKDRLLETGCFHLQCRFETGEREREEAHGLFFFSAEVCLFNSSETLQYFSPNVDVLGVCLCGFGAARFPYILYRMQEC